jgi:hypothetical protein
MGVCQPNPLELEPLELQMSPSDARLRCHPTTHVQLCAFTTFIDDHLAGVTSMSSSQFYRLSSCDYGRKLASDDDGSYAPRLYVVLLLVRVFGLIVHAHISSDRIPSVAKQRNHLRGRHIHDDDLFGMQQPPHHPPPMSRVLSDRTSLLLVVLDTCGVHAKEDRA